jgi:thiamine biosynthesis lipoprotein
VKGLAQVGLALLPGLVAAAPVTEIHYVMGTYFGITAEGAAARPAMRACFREARRLEAAFSRFQPTSELSRVNATAGVPLEVSADFARLLRRAQALGTATRGAFDVTVGTLTELWRRGGEPSGDELAAGRAGVGGTHVRLDGDHVTVARGTQLDFDGIAKGYAVEVCTGRLRAAGIRRALASLGGSSIAAIGGPPGERAWRLPVRGPHPDEIVGVLHLRDAAASISATFGAGGRSRPGTVAHILDPRTGRPLAEEAVGVVVARSATDAEAYSKAVLVWGAPGAARVERLGAWGGVHIGPRGVTRGPRAAGRGTFESLPAPRPLTAGEAALQ